MNSGTNPGDLTERVNSGTNSGDLAEKVNSDTNPEDLAEKVNSGTNLEDLTEKVGMTSSDSSSSVGVISSPGSGGASQGDPEANSSGVSSGPPLLVDARVLRDLEVMKADHDLDTEVTEGSLAVIRGRYSIPAEYGLHASRPGQRPYSSDAPDMCITVDALEADLRFPLHPLIEECLRWWRISPSQVACNSWRYFWASVEGPGLSRLGTYLWRIFASARVGAATILPPESVFGLAGRLPITKIDLGDLRGMPKMSNGKAPSTRAAVLAREVGVSPTREAPKTSTKRLIDAPTEQADDPARRHKKVKVLTRRHKSRHGEGESRSHSKGKEPAAPSEEPDTPVKSDEGDASLVHHRPRSMKDLFKTKVHKGDAGYYTLQMSDLGHQDPDKEMKVSWRGLKNSTKVWNDSSAIKEFEMGLLHPQLARELYMLPSEVLLARAAKEMVLELDALKSGGGLEVVAKAEECASELEHELEKTKRKRDEVLQRLEASEKELNEVRSNLAEIERLLKEVRVRAQTMDDELLQAVKALENARVELPRQAIDC
ncbi:hypothetical protein B296_00022027 [Ensete ventricosum]|uniref:Uncharacterized protein n=1 Tax=Ensete ventricosum TaxID=4639 RepID=A0A426XAU9_ENSVE|nr:hypothetical protein B296_00022027 [Ensete ventricosum]